MNYFKKLCLRGTDEVPSSPYSKDEIIRIAVRGYLDFDSLEQTEETECFFEQQYSYRHHFCAKIKDILFCDEVEDIYIIFQIKDLYFFSCIHRENIKKQDFFKKKYLSKIEKDKYLKGLVEFDINNYDGAGHLKYFLSGYTTPFDLTYLFQSFQIKKIMQSEWNNQHSILMETEEISISQIGANWLVYLELLGPKQWFYDDDLPFQPQKRSLREEDLYFSD